MVRILRLEVIMSRPKPQSQLLAEAARAAAERLDDAVEDGDSELRLTAAGDVSVTLPAKAVDALLEVLQQLAQGNDVAVLPLHAELTTQQAADALNVSRPFVIKLMTTGKLPFRKVGSHRRVRLADVLTYKRLDDARRNEAADALAAEAQALGLGY